MKYLPKILVLAIIITFISCGENKKTEGVSYGKSDAEKVPASERVDLLN